jgi:RNA polymerase sigma factor (sigma-70 family)
VTFGMKSKKRYNIRDLLRRLNSMDAGSAWAEFIDRFAPLIMKVARQFDHQQEKTGECFLYVCEKLFENDFRRLLRFNTVGKARFSTWLGAVVFNLCVDWHRKQYGRVQLLQAISALPAFDHAVYQLCFEQNLVGEEVFQTLMADFPDLTRQQLTNARARVHRILTPRQRWQANVRIQRRKNNSGSQVPDIELLPDTGPGPDLGAWIEQRTDAIGKAMACLSDDQRLLLKLRFEQGLTLKKIAEIMHLGDPFRAKRRLQSALDAVSTQVKINLSA